MDENMNASDHMIVIGDMDKLASFAGPSPIDTSKLLSVFTTHLPRKVGHFGKGIVSHSFHRWSCHFQMSLTLFCFSFFVLGTRVVAIMSTNL
jgi:hypothetical protein